SPILLQPHPRSPLFPYTTLFRSGAQRGARIADLVGKADLQRVEGVGRVLDHLRRPDGRVDEGRGHTLEEPLEHGRGARLAASHEDRKSTRLNSSHQIISYAVFCL